MEMSKSASKKISVLSFIFNMIIVLYHSNITFETLYYSAFVRRFTSNIWEYSANIAMSFFFMTSAFLLYNGADKSNIKAKLKRRIFSVIIPYLVWNSAYFIISVLQHGSFPDFYTIIYRYTIDPFDGPLWYLFVITILSFLSPFVLKLKDKPVFKIAIAVLCLFFAVIYSFNLIERVSGFSEIYIVSYCERLCRYLPSYIVGAYIGIYRCELLEQRFNHKIISILFCVITTFIWCIFGDSLYDSFKFIILLSSPLFIWCALDNKVKSVPSFMKNAFIIYAIHRLFLTVILKLVNKMPPFGEIFNKYIGDIICCLCPFICCLIIWLFVDCMVKILKKLNMKFVLSLLSGGRK